MELTKRQERILEIVKENGPITGEMIAEQLKLTRATLRPDLAILTMMDFLDARPRVGYFYKERLYNQTLLDMFNHILVGEYQSIPIVINEKISAYDAVCTMFLEDVGTLFIVDQLGYLSGVLSRKDLLRASIGNNSLHDIPVHIIMTRMPNITICEKEDLLLEAAQKLVECQIDAMPVVRKTEGGYEVVGRITKTNITKVLLNLAKIQ